MDGEFCRTTTAGDAGLRLDRYLSQCLPDISRERIKRAIRQGGCHVGGQIAREPKTRLTPGQEVRCILPPPEQALTPEPEVAGSPGVEPVWRDADLLVVNKPAGLTVHPCPSCPRGTLVQRLAARYPELLQQEGLRPGIVHRLDKDTSGLMLVALNERTRLRLSEMFAERKIHKEYLALVHGLPPLEGDIREPVGRHPTVKVKMAVVPEHRGGKAAHSQWRVLWAAPDKRLALVRVRIFTGRTHQIRVHMAHLGHPLLGDALYGKTPASGGGAQAGHIWPTAPRQMLHAHRLHFTHPVSGEEMRFAAPPPEDMRRVALDNAAPPVHLVLTGLPGCGKSSLLAALAALGLPVWSADAVVHDLYAPGAPAWEYLRQRFGAAVVATATSPVDRAALRTLMEQEPHTRREVEGMVHALVREDLHGFFARHAAPGTLPAAEIPLYLEAGWRDPQALVVGVSCPTPLRHARLVEHRGWSAARCAVMDGWQWSEARKHAACDLLVDNSLPQEALAEAARSVLRAGRAREAAQREELARLLDSLGT